VEKTGSFRVVIAGGGVAGLEAVLALRSLAADRVSIDLITPEHEFVYSPLVVAEPFGLGRRAHFELQDLLRDAAARHHRDALAAVDHDQRVARTQTGIAFPYDALLVATGTRQRNPLAGAITFSGRAGVTAMGQLLARIERGEVQSVAFVQASRVGWSLPLYELALMTADRLQRRERAGVDLIFVTPEELPLELFGDRAGAALRNRLEQCGIELHAGAEPVEYGDGALKLRSGEVVAAEQVVTLAVPDGHEIAGLPANAEGFIDVDEHQRLEGMEDVYAAGDLTSFPVKQGGIAAQQADTAALAIAAAAGAPVAPVPFRPILRGVLLTGGAPAYLRAPIVKEGGDRGDLAAEPLWWPPAKIAARHLGPLLALRAGAGAVPAPPAESGISVLREYKPELGSWLDLAPGGEADELGSA
jgi:sulfide:quinone oxidoreductase